jgi:hypothetical protein
MDLDGHYCSFIITFQLEVEAKKLFDNIMIDLGLISILEFINIKSLEDFISH